MKIELKITLLLVLFLPYFSIAQKTELSKMDSLVYQITYKTTKEIFTNENNYVYKKDTFDISEKLPGYFIPADSINIITDSIKKNLAISIDEGFFGLNLKLDSEFPSVGNEMIRDLIEIDLLEYSIEDQKGLKIEFNDRFSNVSIGGGGSFSYANGEGSSYNYRTITVTNRLETKDSVQAPFQGTASYSLTFLKSIPIIKLSRESIGSEFTIIGQRFRVVDFFNNNLVLDNISKTVDPALDLDIINVSQDEQFEYKPYSLGDLNVLKSKGEIDENAESFNLSRTKISKMLYKLFNDEPDLTFEEYQKQFTPEDFKALSKDQPKYIVISHPAPLQKVILYAYDYTVPIQLKGDL